MAVAKTPRGLVVLRWVTNGTWRHPLAICVPCQPRIKAVQALLQDVDQSIEKMVDFVRLWRKQPFLCGKQPAHFCLRFFQPTHPVSW